MAVKGKLILVLVLCVFLNILLTVLGRGSFMHSIIVIGVCLYVGLPLLVLSAVSNFVAKSKSSGKAMAVSQFCFYCAVLLWSFVVSVFSGGALLNYDISNAKKYCESFVPALDEYNDKNGHYPRSLTPIANQNKVPRLLIQGSYYNSDGDSFAYSFTDPGGMMNGFAFSSKDRQWYNWD